MPCHPIVHRDMKYHRFPAVNRRQTATADGSCLRTSDVGEPRFAVRSRSGNQFSFNLLNLLPTSAVRADPCLLASRCHEIGRVLSKILHDEAEKWHTC